MNVLVTGGAGFIGSAVAARLVRDGHTVTVVDNFNQYYDPTLKRARQQAFLDQVTVVEADITDAAALDQLFSIGDFRAVCHIAGQAGVRYSVEAPETYVATNITGTQVLLETMRQHQVSQLVYASTSSVYGVDTPVPFVETATADRPVSVYAATKRAAELLAHTYHHQYDIQVTCLRFFTVYGPWSRPDMAMLKFAEAMTAGNPIDIYNHGDLRRDFTYIDDIVNGFVAALEQPFPFEVINLGNGQPVQLLAFVEALETALGVTADKRLLPMQPGDVYETYADTTKAKQLLGFEAKTDFATGIGRFADWYRDYVS